MAQEKGGWYKLFREAFDNMSKSVAETKSNEPSPSQSLSGLKEEMERMNKSLQKSTLDMDPYLSDSLGYYDAKNIDDVDFAKTFTVFSKEPGGDGFSEDMGHTVQVGFKNGKIASVLDYRPGENGEEQEWEVYGKDKLAKYFKKFFPQDRVHFVVNGNQKSPYYAYGGYRSYNPKYGLEVPNQNGYSSDKVGNAFLPSVVFKPYNSWSQIFHDAFSEMNRRNEASKDIGNDAIKGMGR